MIKRMLFLAILLFISEFIFSNNIISGFNRDKLSENNKNEEDIKYWKRHFIDISFTGGMLMETTLHQYDVIYEYPHARINFGVLLGLSGGYQYAFSKYFAFGGGTSSFVSIKNIGRSLIIANNNNSYNAFIENDEDMFVFDPISFGHALMLLFMFGDLKDKKIAFLLDIGGGYIGAIKIGFYIKGFVFKLGYHKAFSIYEDNITIDLGYKFNL